MFDDMEGCLIKMVVRIVAVGVMLLAIASESLALKMGLSQTAASAVQIVMIVFGIIAAIVLYSTETQDPSSSDDDGDDRKDGWQTGYSKRGFRLGRIFWRRKK